MQRPDPRPQRNDTPPLRLYVEEDVADEPADFDPDDPPHTFDINRYWAGRNRASRLSARSAA